MGNSPLRQMVRTIVDYVAALAEAFEITQPVIARVVIEVGGGQDDAGLNLDAERWKILVLS